VGNSQRARDGVRLVLASLGRRYLVCKHGQLCQARGGRRQPERLDRHERLPAGFARRECCGLKRRARHLLRGRERGVLRRQQHRVSGPLGTLRRQLRRQRLRRARLPAGDECARDAPRCRRLRVLCERRRAPLRVLQRQKRPRRVWGARRGGHLVQTKRIHARQQDPGFDNCRHHAH
jgi:hypothetical protein